MPRVHMPLYGSFGLFGSANAYYAVQTTGNVLYHFFIDTNSDLSFAKSTDGGITWNNPTVVRAGTVISFAVWYDRWSDIAAGKIHVATVDSGVDDVFYRSVDTENSDALSTQTTVVALLTLSSVSTITITRARGGNLYVKFNDAGDEGGFYRSTDVGATWGARTDSEALALDDRALLVPGFASDNQDIMGVFWDADADEISRIIYDNSADSWAEASIATSMVELSLSTAGPNWAVAVDLTNSRIVLVAWSATDTLNADLRCWTLTEGAVTEVTNVVTNSTDDQGLCALGIDTTTGYWHVAYAGKSDGSETWNTSLNVYTKVSQDSGATWGAETSLSGGALPNDVHWLGACPRFVGPPKFLYQTTTTGFSQYTVYLTQNLNYPRAQNLLGV